MGLADKEDDKTGESVWGDAMALFSAIAVRLPFSVVGCRPVLFDASCY